MIDHDKNVGQLLEALDELGIAEDTIVIYSTDNGPRMNTWPDWRPSASSHPGNERRASALSRGGAGPPGQR
jgi:arylsulfatase A-like enzyme